MTAKKKGIALLFAVLVFSFVSLFSPIPAAEAEETFLLENYLPQRTLAFCSSGDVARMMQSMEETAIYKIFKEEEVQTFLEDIIKKVEEMLKKVESRIGMSSEELCSFPMGQVGVAFLGMTSTGSDTIPDIVLSVDLREGRSKFEHLYKQLLQYLKEQGKGEFTESSHRFEERTIHHLDLAHGPKVYFTFLMDALVAALNKDSLEQVVSNFTHEKKEVLAENPQFVKTRKMAGVEETSFFLYAAPEAFFSYFQGSLPPDKSEQMKFFGVDSISSFGYGSSFLEGGFRDVFFLDVKERNNFIGKLMECSGKGPLKSLRLVPKESLFFQTFTLNIPKIWDQIFAMIKAFNPAEFKKAEKGMQKFEEASGMDFRNDLLNLIGEEFCMYVTLSATGPIPEIAGMVELKQPEKIDALLKGLLEKFGRDLSLKEITFENCPLRYVESLGPKIPFSPAFAIIEGFLVLGGTPQTVKKAIRQFKGEGESILNNEDFSRLLKLNGIKDPGDLAQITYMDLRKGFSFGYNLAMPFIPLAFAGKKDLPVDFALLPTSDAIARHLFGYISYQRRIENGILSETYSPVGNPFPFLALMGSTFTARAEGSPMLFTKRAPVRKMEKEGIEPEVEVKKVPVEEVGFLGVIIDMSYEGDGALLQRILVGSPAEKSGLKPGDIIVNISGNEVNSGKDLKTVLQSCRVGEEVIVTLQREEEVQRVKAVLDEKKKYLDQLEDLEGKQVPEKEAFEEEKKEEVKKSLDPFAMEITLEVTDTTLEEVFDFISKTSGIKFHVEGEEIKKLSFTGKIVDRKVKWIVELICNLYDLTYSVEGEGGDMVIVIKKK